MSVVDHFAACLSYLERECNYGRPEPYRQVDLRYVMVLWLLAECADAHTVMEIGVGPESVSGCTFIHSLAQRPNGHLISVDLDDKLPQEKYKALAAEKGVIWTVAHGDSLTVEMPVIDQVDVLYIDGNHDENHAINDLRIYLPYLRPGGYLAIDDFPPHVGVGDGRKGIEAQVPWFLHLAHDVPAGNGRLIWQKPL